MKAFVLISLVSFWLTATGFSQTNSLPATGNVGVGTTSPQGPLHIKGVSGWGTLKISPNGDNEEAGISIGARGLVSDYTNSWLLARGAWGLGPDLKIGNTTLGAVMTFLHSNGNIGIGTANPLGKLSVVGKAVIGSGDVTINDINDAIYIQKPEYNQIHFFQPQSSVNSYISLNKAGALAFGAGNTTPGMQIWTGSNHRLSLGTNGLERLTVMPDGNIGIGTTTPTTKLAVNGTVRAVEIKVENSVWPDYVFLEGYQMKTLTETEQHIKEKGHLPGIPSAGQVKANGINLGEMNAKLLEKIEEITLYLIEMEKRDRKQQAEINELKLRL
jgi:hypothetical protein